MPSGANLQLAHDIALYVSDQKLRHRDSNDSAPVQARLVALVLKPGIGLEPTTPSLPWKCSTN